MVVGSGLQGEGGDGVKILWHDHSSWEPIVLVSRLGPEEGSVSDFVDHLFRYCLYIYLSELSLSINRVGYCVLDCWLWLNLLKFYFRVGFLVFGLNLFYSVDWLLLFLSRF